MIAIAEKIRIAIAGALKNLGIEAGEIILEHPADLVHGDYSTNVALVYAKEVKMKPRELAEKIVAKINGGEASVEKIEIAGSGFINFYLSPKFFADSVAEILSLSKDFGRNQLLAGKKVMVEYTDPNAFKVLHIGHLMSNAIGESIARLIGFSGAEVIRTCYPSDVGLNTAKAVWGAMKNQDAYPKPEATLSDKAAFLGQAYVFGTKAYETDESAKKEIEEINKKIFEKSDPAIMKIYNEGRRWSLAHFEELYQKLGTKFDRYFYESEMAPKGLVLVAEFLKKRVFEKSEGAVVFRGEKFGLHTRVFITSQGLPTYEAKELGLNKAKFEAEPDLAVSIIVTANEQSDYFKVVLKALAIVFPEIAAKTKHIAHGLMRFASGKMSSRTGNIITGESLIAAVENLVFEKVKDRDLPLLDKQKIAGLVGIGAIKYSVLRQATGADIVYDFEKSISFEGDSGPYLQYTYARARSVLRKADLLKSDLNTLKSDFKVGGVERLLYRFPEVVERAVKEYEPHHITTYLTELAGVFNNFYAVNQIVGSAEEDQRLALTRAVSIILKNGLWLLGIEAPEKM